MAITRAQQAKQMLQDGGRIGFKKGRDTDYQQRGTDRQTYSATQQQQNFSARDDSPPMRTRIQDEQQEEFRKKQLQELIAKQQEEKAFEPFESLIIRPSGIPSIGGKILDALRGPRQKLLDRNVDFFRFDPRTAKARQKYGLTAQGYKDYMSARLAGTIDAAGNPIMTGDEDDSPFMYNTTLPQSQLPAADDQETEDQDERFLAFRADGGRIGAAEGGIMDLETGRQMYFLGKLVKKATRAVKKVAKSPIGKAALLAGLSFGIPGTSIGGLFGRAKFGGDAMGLFGTKGIGPLFTNLMGGKITPNIVDEVALTGKQNIFQKALGLVKDNPLEAIAATSVVAGLLTPEQENQAQLLADNTGIDIEEARNQILRAAAGQDDFRGRAFKADGGIMRLGYQEGSKEPVAKKTMPLLDMGGKEMDLREDGGFVPIGRMEKADDVPARLSKNEFVFTADAVRNAGDGNVDKGAEVMYNMMKNLESGGDVSEESQGLEGARRMFQTSQRLEEVI